MYRVPSRPVLQAFDYDGTDQSHHVGGARTDYAGSSSTGLTVGDYNPIAWWLRTKMALLEYVTWRML